MGRVESEGDLKGLEEGRGVEGEAGVFRESDGAEAVGEVDAGGGAEDDLPGVAAGGVFVEGGGGGGDEDGGGFGGSGGGFGGSGWGGGGGGFSCGVGSGRGWCGGVFSECAVEGLDVF